MDEQSPVSGLQRFPNLIIETLVGCGSSDADVKSAGKYMDRIVNISGRLNVRMSI